MYKRFALTALLLCLTACNPPINYSYVNIPPQDNDVATHDPNHRVVVDVIAEAYRALLVERPMDERFQVILPEGTTPKTYGRLMERVDKLAMWSSDGSIKEMPVIEVSQVRIRGLSAEVDLIRPVRPDDRRAVPHIATIYMDRQPFGDWVARRVKHWQISAVEAAIKQQR